MSYHTPSENRPSDDILWKQYCLHIDLYKFYLETTLKLNIFYYGITGGIISYYFKNFQNDIQLKYAIIFAIVFSIFLCCLYIYGANLSKITRAEVFYIRDELKLMTAPELDILRIFLLLSALLVFITGCGLMMIVFVK